MQPTKKKFLDAINTMESKLGEKLPEKERRSFLFTLLLRSGINNMVVIPKHWKILTLEKYWTNLIKLDKELFKHFPARKNKLVSGKYAFKVSFPEKSVSEFVANIILRRKAETSAPVVKYITGFNQNFSKDTTGAERFDTNSYDLHHRKKIISWQYAKTTDGPYFFYVGIVDGERIWGKVYRRGISSWHEYTPEVGTWVATPLNK